MVKSTRSKRATREKRSKKIVSSRRHGQKRETMSRSHLSLPPDVSLFNPKEEGDYKMEIIPYEIKTLNPMIDEDDIGGLTFERTYYLHRGIGARNKSIVCPARTFDMPCPICEHADELREEDPEANKKLLSKLWAQERQLFLLVLHSERKKGLQLWDVAFGNFGKLLDSRIKRRRGEEEELAEFHDPDEGETIIVSLDEEKFEGNGYLKASHISFKPRSEQITAAVQKFVEKAPCLDEVLVQLDYDKIKDLLFDSDDSDEAEDDDPPRRRSKKKASGRSRPSSRTSKKTGKKKTAKKKRSRDADEDDWDEDLPF